MAIGDEVILTCDDVISFIEIARGISRNILHVLVKKFRTEHEWDLFNKNMKLFQKLVKDDDFFEEIT